MLKDKIPACLLQTVTSGLDLQIRFDICKDNNKPIK